MSENTEKTLNLDDTRLFRVSTVLGYLPGFDVLLVNPVEVVAGGKRIGWASVQHKDFMGKVVADLVFDYASPERLSIETKSEKLYAVMQTKIAAFDMDLEVRIVRIEIDRKPYFPGQPSLDEAVLEAL